MAIVTAVQAQKSQKYWHIISVVLHPYLPIMTPSLQWPLTTVLRVVVVVERFD